MEKLLVTSQFSFSHNVFHSIKIRYCVVMGKHSFERQSRKQNKQFSIISFSEIKTTFNKPFWKWNCIFRASIFMWMHKKSYIISITLSFSCCPRASNRTVISWGTLRGTALCLKISGIIESKKLWFHSTCYIWASPKKMAFENIVRWVKMLATRCIIST